MSTIDERIRERAAADPSGVALVTHVRDREHVWTWGELDDATAGAADRLAAAARTRSSVLFTTSGGDPDRLMRMIAALRTDSPVAVIPATAPEAERQALREEILRTGHHVVDGRGGEDRHGQDGHGQDGHGGAGQAPTVPIPAESLLLGTGGSTSRPKLVIDTWTRTVGRRPRPVRPSTAMNWRPGQRQLVVGPLHHAAPLTYFIEGLTDGNQLILPPPAAPDATLSIIRDRRVEWLQLTPYHMRQLAAAGSDRQLSSIRGMLHLAAPCPHPLKRRWLDLIGADRVFEMYGATEGIGVTIASGAEWLRRPGTVGRGFLTQIRIQDPRGRSLPAGHTGQVYLRAGTSVRSAYLRRDDRIATTFDNFKSVGDHGHLDGDGYLYLTARQATRIQVGGETVNPSEVEYVLAEYPGVLDAAVMGVPDERLGESLTALVVPDGPLDTRDIRDYVRRRLARHKVPRTIRCVSRLPRTEAGKLDRAQLAAADPEAIKRRGERR